jgi:hypothetical protein
VTWQCGMTSGCYKKGGRKGGVMSFLFFTVLEITWNLPFCKMILPFCSSKFYRIFQVFGKFYRIASRNYYRILNKFTVLHSDDGQTTRGIVEPESVIYRIFMSFFTVLHAIR